MADSLFTSMLSAWQWGLFALIPPAIVALYLLKLRRVPRVVSSTYLWRKSIEDIRANSLWQKLRQNLLLYLQLLLVGLLMLACLRPNWLTSTRVGKRVILLIDQSASMSATDVMPNRLEEAKRQAHDVIESMESGSSAMIVSFSDRARVQQTFTTNRGELLRKLKAIEPTGRRSDVLEALQVAAGLANPGRTATDAGDIQVADALPAEVYLFSDGNFAETPDFSWGNLKPRYIPIGRPAPRNVAILGFGAATPDETTERTQAFVQLRNYSQEETSCELELRHDGELVDAARQTLAAEATATLEFHLGRLENGVLEARLSVDDDYAMDNTAWVSLEPPGQARVLVVGTDSEALKRALQTDDVRKRARSEFLAATGLQDGSYEKRIRLGGYDLVLFDGCTPPELPPANTVFLGVAPPSKAWSLGPMASPPVVVDLETTHPIMRYIDMSDVRIAKGYHVAGPNGQRILVEADQGPLIVVAPREAYEDLVVGFPLLDNQEGNLVANTDWPIRLSFPLFIRNLLHYFGQRDADRTIRYRPGDPIEFDTAEVRRIRLQPPRGTEEVLSPDSSGKVVYHATDSAGVYRGWVQERDRERPFAIALNLFDDRESDLAPRETWETKWSDVKASDVSQVQPSDAWRFLVLAALVLLLFEWYFFHQVARI